MHAAAISYLLKNNELLTEDQLIAQLPTRRRAATSTETDGSRLLYLLLLMRLDFTENPPFIATERVIEMFACRQQRAASEPA